MRSLIFGLSLLAILPTTALAKTYEEVFNAPPPPKLKELYSSINFRLEKLPLLQAHAALNNAGDFYYLDAGDAAKILTKLWGNPPEAASDALGMIFPRRTPPEDPTAWGAIVSYSDDGYVSDEGAQSIDYDQVLTELKSETAQNNVQRKSEGYEPITLVGWASPPYYDSKLHALHWARDLVFGTDMNRPHTLNYQLRILGRDGVLQLNFVAGINELQQIEKDVPDVAALVAYDSDKKYEAHEEGDKIAAYGLAGLIATAVGAKVAAKVGLLTIGLLFLKKGAVIIAVIAGAIFKPIAKLFRRKPNQPPPYDSV
jgi:uncharacterized membrane-anchored protein